jgi:hypothetical protein
MKPRTNGAWRIFWAIVVAWFLVESGGGIRPLTDAEASGYDMVGLAAWAFAGWLLYSGYRKLKTPAPAPNPDKVKTK